MIRKNEQVVVIPDAFTKEECEDLIARLDAKPMHPGGIYRKQSDGTYDKVVDEQYRKVDEYQIQADEFQDARTKMAQLGREVNVGNFDFNLDGEVDRMLYIHYGDGSFFERHRDAFGDSELGFKKLAMVLQLSPPEDFNGGVLSIEYHGPQPQGQGMVIVFPVYLLHSVSSVNGSRKMLVNWCTSKSHFQ